MEKKSDVYERAFQFACRVLKVAEALSRHRSMNRNLMNQLLDAATSIGSNVEEVKGAQSRADFHAKVRIALKEARESHYWSRLLSTSGIAGSPRITPLLQEADEIVAILTTIARKTNSRNTQPLSS